MSAGTSSDPLLAEDIGSAFPEPAQTLHQILTGTAKRVPDRTALVSCHQPWGYLHSCHEPPDPPNEKAAGYLRWSYAQLENASEHFASYLSKNGIKKGDAIVATIYSCVEWAVIFWAAARLGCPFVPINPAIIGRVNEIQHIMSVLEKIGALIVNDDSVMNSFSRNAPKQIDRIDLRLILESNVSSGWTSFADVFRISNLSKPPDIEQSMDEIVLIVLTSGTTTLPKGCPHTNRTLVSACIRHQIMYSLDESRISCNHMPLFHLAGVMESLWAWAYGGKAVYPNKTFEAHATLDAINGEACTDMCLVPSMLRALVDHPAIPETDTSSLALIKLAANDVMGSDARACSEVLHAKIVTNCFGMTETSGTTEIFSWKNGVFEDTEPLPVGRVAPGARARVCATGSRKPVKRGVIGELQLSGRTIIDSYIGDNDDDSRFYSEDDVRWHSSGDRAVMAETGEITVLGRYKDIINRAGENIAPLVMERVLNQIEGVDSSQVVGVPDEVAGEVPVAVIKGRNGSLASKALLYDRVVKELGVTFALERVVDLEDLAIDDFPTTATGKVRKVDVKAIVLDHLHQISDRSTPRAAKDTTEAILKRLWARLSGVPTNHISSTKSLEGMVDSVTIMRLQNRIKKEIGKTISLEELNNYPTIAEQAELLDCREQTMVQGNATSSYLDREGPPKLRDIVHTGGNEVVYEEIRQQAQKKLHSLDLSWDADVEEVLPIYDYVRFLGENTESLLFRIVFACSHCTTNRLRHTLEKVLSIHPMLRTIFVNTPLADPSWVIVRSSPQWYKQMIVDGGAVRTEEDMLTTNLNASTSTKFIDSKPIPLFHITMYFIETTQSAGFVVYGDHSTYDAHYVLSIFMEDLGRALNDPDAVFAPRPPYSLFANSYYNHHTSIPAQSNIDYFKKRIQGITKRQAGLWPRKTFRDTQSPPERLANHLLLKGDIAPGLAGLTRRIKLNMSNNQYLKIHKIPHSVAIKAAIAIFNTQQTGTPYAMFSNIQMCRSYPFLDPQIATHLPDPMDLPGPTFEVSIDNLYLDPNEKISNLLHRLHIDQIEQTTRARCPWFSLLDQLSPEDSHTIKEVHRRQAINYNPVITPDPEAKIRNLSFTGSANLSIMWWCGMVDQDTMQMRVTWCDEVMGVREAEEALDGFEKNFKWIVDGGSWGRGLGECGS